MFGLVGFIVLTTMFTMNNKDYPGSTLLGYSLPNQFDLFPQTNKKGTLETEHILVEGIFTTHVWIVFYCDLESCYSFVVILTCFFTGLG